MADKTKITAINAAGPGHRVVTVTGGDFVYRREPCDQCPWRCDQIGTFPAKAFVHSARTAYDMAGQTFACHMSGTEKPAICAGFLLRGAVHNLAVRMKLARGVIDLSQVKDGGHMLFPDYRSMAVANGVGPRNPALKGCR